MQLRYAQFCKYTPRFVHDISLICNIFITIYENVNLIISISHHPVSVICLLISLIPSLEF